MFNGSQEKSLVAFGHATGHRSSPPNKVPYVKLTGVLSSTRLGAITTSSWDLPTGKVSRQAQEIGKFPLFECWLVTLKTTLLMKDDYAQSHTHRCDTGAPGGVSSRPGLGTATGLPHNRPCLPEALGPSLSLASRVGTVGSLTPTVRVGTTCTSYFPPAFSSSPFSLSFPPFPPLVPSSPPRPLPPFPFARPRRASRAAARAAFTESSPQGHSGLPPV